MAARGRSWLTPNVRTLSGVSFLQDAASELLYPVLPIFLTVTLGAPAAVVGAVEGVAEGGRCRCAGAGCPFQGNGQRLRDGERIVVVLPGDGERDEAPDDQAAVELVQEVQRR